MSKLTSIAKKLLEQNISGEEWEIILQDWLLENKVELFDPNNEHSFLISFLKKDIPLNVLHFITEHYTKNIWEHSTDDNKTPLYYLCDYFLNDKVEFSDQTLEFFINTFGVNGLLQHYPTTEYNFAEKLINKKHTKSLNSILNQKGASFFDTLNEDKTITIAQKIVQDWVTFPLFFQHKGAFFEETSHGVLWKKVFQSRCYHSSFLEFLTKLDNSLSYEDYIHNNTSLFITHQDWDNYLVQKKEIHNTLFSFQFEDNLNSDWKSSIKENKNWKIWRNDKGTNFMHWLAFNDPKAYIKKLEIKRYHHLTTEKDFFERDASFYFFSNFAKVFNHISWRKEEEFLKDLKTNFFPVFLSLIDINPQKGLICNALELNNHNRIRNFKEIKMNTSSAFTNFYAPFIQKNFSLFFNGFNDNHCLDLIENPLKFNRISDFFNTFLHNQDIDVDPFFNKLNTNSKLILCGLFIKKNIFSQSDIKMIEEIPLDEITLSIEQIDKVRKTFVTSNYYLKDKVTNFSEKLFNLSLTKQLNNISEESTVSIKRKI